MPNPTQSLDEWFAAADDVLADWHGDTDAMHYEPSKGERVLPVADSYYAQAMPGASGVREWAATFERHADLEAACATFPQRWFLGADDGDGVLLGGARRFVIDAFVPWVPRVTPPIATVLGSMSL